MCRRFFGRAGIGAARASVLAGGVAEFSRHSLRTQLQAIRRQHSQELDSIEISRHGLEFIGHRHTSGSRRSQHGLAAEPKRASHCPWGSQKLQSGRSRVPNQNQVQRARRRSGCAPPSRVHGPSQWTTKLSPSASSGHAAASSKRRCRMTRTYHGRRLKLPAAQ